MEGGGKPAGPAESKPRLPREAMQEDKIRFDRPPATSAASEASSRWRRPGRDGPSAKVEAVLHRIVPDFSQAVLGRLKQERVRTAADLCGLDKDDLRQLGFTMVERSRLLRWSKTTAAAVQPPSPGRSGAPSVTSRWRSDNTRDMSPSPIATRDSNRASTQRRETWVPEEDSASELEDALQQHHQQRCAREERLDGIQGQADFWCELVSSLGWMIPSVGAHGADLDALEALYDLSPERVQEVYRSMQKGDDGAISEADLGAGLERWGLPPMDRNTLGKILRLVDENQDGQLQVEEFQTVLTRLLLARLLAPGAIEGDEGKRLRVVDYNSLHEPREQLVCTAGVCMAGVCSAGVQQFFFGHRPRSQAEEPLMRWIHMEAVDERWLLGLAIKYGLHPLAIEDVLERSPTKFDRFGQHFCITLEKLFLASATDGSERIQFGGTHLSIFCAGPPHFDTVITVSQTEGGKEGANDWSHKVNGLITSIHSRVRERRGNFLLYKIVDECADELLNVVRAYANRIERLEEICNKKAKPGHALWEEVQQAKQELNRVERRSRGLQRVVRRVVDDPDLFVGLSGYMDDIQEHLEEAQDDAAKLIMKCDGVLGAFAQGQERLRARQAEQQNNILFVLTIVTAVFTPMTFVAGVYGMNFVDGKGRPTIPELNWRHGYLIFWVANAVYLGLMGLVLFLLLVWPGYWRSYMPEAEADAAEREPLLPRGSAEAV